MRARARKHETAGRRGRVQLIANTKHILSFLCLRSRVNNKRQHDIFFLGYFRAQARYVQFHTP